MNPKTQPRTAAGWKFLRYLESGVDDGFRGNASAILAIEAEAAEQSVPLPHAAIPLEIERLSLKWETEAETIESATAGSKSRRAVAAEALRACSRDLRNLWGKMAWRAEQSVPLDALVLALALHEERSDRWGGCGNPTEAYDDHMTFHQTRADRIIEHYARLVDGAQATPQPARPTWKQPSMTRMSRDPKYSDPVEPARPAERR